MYWTARIWGGGGSNIDSSTLVALQSDMVELKSDIADLTLQLDSLENDVAFKENTVSATYTGNGSHDLTINLDADDQKVSLTAVNQFNDTTRLYDYALEMALADLYDDSARYTFVNGVLSKSTDAGASWQALTLPGSGSESDSTAVFVTTSNSSGSTPYGLNMMRMTQDSYKDMVRITNDSNTTGLDYHLQTALGAIGVSGIPTLNADLATRTRLALVEANDYTAQPKLKYTYNGGATWYDFNTGSSGSGSSNIESLVLQGALRKVYMSAQTYSDSSQSVIKLAATIGDTGTTSQQYALAVPAIANSASPRAQMRPTINGIETSLDYGKTWKLLSASSGDSAGSDSNSDSGVYFRNSYDSGLSSAYINYNGSNVYISLHGVAGALLYPLCQPLADIAHPLRAVTQLAVYDGAICLGSDYDGWRQISFADLSDAESLSLSNMVWLSDNASKLAALLNS